MLLIIAFALSFVLPAFGEEEAETETEPAAAEYVVGANYGDFMATTSFESEQDFNEPISSFCGLGDELYMITYSLTTLYVHKVGAQAPEIYPLNVEIDTGDYSDIASSILTDGERLLLITLTAPEDIGAGGDLVTLGLYEITIRDGEASAQFITSSNTSLFSGGYGFPTAWVGFKDYAVATYYAESGEQLLCTYNYADGTVCDAGFGSTSSVSPYDNESALVQCYDWNDPENTVTLVRYTPASGETQELARLSELPGGLAGVAYDAQGGRILCVREGEIRVLDASAGALGEPVSDMPLEIYSSATCFVLEGGYYACANYAGYVVRSLNGGQEGQRKLRVYDMSWNNTVMQAQKDFTSAHRDATAIIMHEHNGSIIDEMMNQDSAVDIYVMYANSQEFEALRDRGYLADFSESPALMALAGRIVPNLLEDLSCNGAFAALPVDAYMSLIRFNVPLLEELGYAAEDIPTDWNGFMDFLIELEDKVPDDGSVLLADPWYSVESVRSELLGQVFMCYQMTLKYAPEYARTEDMTAILEKLSSIDFEKLGLSPSEIVNDENYTADYELDDLLMEWSSGMQLGRLASERYFAPVMGLTADSPRYITTDVTVAIVNPYSEDRDLALAFMEALGARLTTEVEYMTMPDAKEPVPDKHHDEMLETVDGYIAEIQVQLDNAEPMDVQMLQEQLADYERWRADVEKDIWEISEADIAWRDANIQYMKLSTANWLYAEENGEANELIEQFAAGQLPADRLMAEIDRKIRMMILENS